MLSSPVQSSAQANQPAASPPALLVIGGFAGTGKTAIARRLSSDLRIPRLGSDTIGRAIRCSAALEAHDVDAQWIAYDVLFRLCADFVSSGVSTVVDLTMGWEFQWTAVDDIVRQYPRTRFVPVILRCSHSTCIERIRERHAVSSDYYDAPDVYVKEPKLVAIWNYLAQLERPEVRLVDAGRPFDQVYADVRRYVSERLGIE